MTVAALERFHSWKLERLSPATFPPDILIKVSRVQPVSEREIRAITGLMRRGQAYRCRIAKGRYYFAGTAEEAVKAAVDAERKKRN